MLSDSKEFQRIKVFLSYLDRIITATKTINTSSKLNSFGLYFPQQKLQQQLQQNMNPQQQQHQQQVDIPQMINNH